MDKQRNLNYSQILKVIESIQQNAKGPLDLDEIAKKAGFSPSHVEQIFIDWAGVKAEKFLKDISVQHAKQILNNSTTAWIENANNTEFSASIRDQNLVVKIERMTPEEYKNEGENFTINYSFGESLFGEILVASTSKGICYMGFLDDRQIAFSELKKRFAKAHFTEQTDDIQQNILQIFTRNKINPIKLHLKGTDFQVKVWKALLQIPMGDLTTYKNIATIIQKPKAARAVGTAIGNNPIAFLIPCHRVIQSSGIFGGYMWGTTRKTSIIGWEVSNSRDRL